METTLSICSVVDAGLGELRVNGYDLFFNLGDSQVESEQEFHQIVEELKGIPEYSGPFALLAETEDDEGNRTKEVLEVVYLN